MRQLGITENNERIYQLSASYGVDESGMIPNNSIRFKIESPKWL